MRRSRVSRPPRRAGPRCTRPAESLRSARAAWAGPEPPRPAVPPCRPRGAAPPLHLQLRVTLELRLRSRRVTRAADALVLEAGGARRLRVEQVATVDDDRSPHRGADLGRRERAQLG